MSYKLSLLMLSVVKSMTCETERECYNVVYKIRCTCSLCMVIGPTIFPRWVCQTYIVITLELTIVKSLDF